jgi:excisionase family DNA binding protein
MHDSSRSALLASAAVTAIPLADRLAKDSNRLAYTIDEAVHASGIGRTKMYALIRSGDLDARKLGRRTLIPAEALRSLLQRLPAFSPVADRSERSDREARTNPGRGNAKAGRR